MPVEIPVDYDRRTGVFAVWIRDHSSSLSIGLVLVGMLVSSLGYFNVIPEFWAYPLKMGLGMFTIGTIAARFVIVVSEEASVTAAGSTTLTATAHTSDDNESDE